MCKEVQWIFFFFFNKCYWFCHIEGALTSHCLQCIASTTIDEYRMHFEKDKALARRFQPVWIGEPSQVVFNICIFILRYLRGQLVPNSIKFVNTFRMMQ
jgi:hypothetical protein